MRKTLTARERAIIDEAVLHFKEHQLLFEGFAKSLMSALASDPHLLPLIHFIRYRVKTPERLQHKLEQKTLARPRGSAPQITARNLFERINDLAGIRILHLHTNQIEEI